MNAEPNVRSVQAPPGGGAAAVAAAQRHATSPPTPRLTAGDDPNFVHRRLHSLDAYRGLIMVALAFTGFGLAETASRHLEGNPDSWIWQTVNYEFRHVEWVGCTFWDLIQPSFMFMVGVSMAFSYTKRQQLGHSYPRMLGHAVWRSIVLILLGIFLISNWSSSTDWSLVNVLTQIGLGYTFLFLLWGRSFRTQAIAAGLILVGTWTLYASYHASAGIDISQGAPQVGVSAEWARQHLAGMWRVWHKNANVGHAIDLWLLNQLPQREPFLFNRGGYETINFLPSVATMIFGLMAGDWLRSQRSDWQKLAILVAAGVAGLALGQVLSLLGVCPMIKRIWTPSWAIFSGGWCLLILAGFYAVIDVVGFRRWAFPLILVGVNSIAVYCMSMLLKPWVIATLQRHLGENVFRLQVRLGDKVYPLVGEAYAQTVQLYEPMIQATLVGLVFWLVCLWLYRQKIFIRI
ncbi:MAG: DUF5009 domain-containing protein [Planctomycetes bacterium]|nr:DUF5009 domain-containing protein [Planctomycetota bacterium]